MTDTDDTLLIDRMYRMTFGKPVQEWTSNKLMRRALTEARRFTLDDRMSRFLADIACAAYKRSIVRQAIRVMHQARRTALLPHHVIWVEFDVEQYNQRERDILQESEVYATPIGERHLREGWLLNDFDHRDVDREFRVHVFRLAVKDDSILVRASPITVHWRTDEAPSCLYPQNIDQLTKQPCWEFFLTEAAVAMQTDDHALGKSMLQVAPAYKSELIKPSPDLAAAFEAGKVTVDLLARSGAGMLTGLMNRVWALLSTINDLPILYRPPTRLTKGFMARAQYRRLLDHKVITLNVPQSVDPRKLARKVVADAKRRAHMVRGHWRKDFYHPLTPFCAHEFEPAGQHLVCRHCRGHKIWIAEHIRGDAHLGFVAHDYAVKHDERQQQKGAAQ